MTFPVRILDRTFVQADFDGTAWQTNLYLAFEKMVLQTYGGTITPVNRHSTSSVTSRTIGTGTLTFTVGTNLRYVPQVTHVFIVNAASTAQWMQGLVTAYNATTGLLTVSINVTLGSGTFATWNVVMIPGRYLPGTERLNLSADYGGLGNLDTSAPANDVIQAAERRAIGLPTPRDGLVIFTDFLEHADFSRNDSSGDWQLVTNEPVARFGFAHNSNEFTSGQGPNHGDGVQGIWSVQAEAAGRRSSIILGKKGFISAFEPGDFYLVAALKFSQTFAATDLYTCRFGLAADRSSKLGDVFASGGLGFEITETALGKEWFSVFNDGTSRTKSSLGILSPLSTWAVCHIYGNMRNREVHFRAVLSADIGANEFLPLPQQYRTTHSLENWPADNNMLMHPVLGIDKITGAVPRAVFIDRMLLRKSLAR